MVDTYVSGAYGEICVGSSPISDTIYKTPQGVFFMHVIVLGRRTHKAKPCTGSSGSKLRLEFSVKNSQNCNNNIFK